MSNRLTGIVVDELSLVDSPAEPGAKVTLFKREGDASESIDEVWVEEMIELGKGQPTSKDVSGGDPKIKIRRKDEDDEDDDEQEVYKGASTGVVAEAEIHRHFTNFADGLYAGGYLTREERIGLSGAIGDALQAFTSEVEANHPQLFIRKPYQSPDGVEKRNRDFSQEKREEYAASGVALKDKSFPIPDKDALRRAIQSIGRAGEEKRASVIAHIKRRAQALGALEMIPDSFKKMDGWDIGQGNGTISDGTQPAEVSKQTEGAMPDIKIEGLDLSTLPEEVQTALSNHVGALTKRAEDAETEAKEAQTELNVLKSGENGGEENEEDILKNADPVIRKILDEAKAEAAEAQSIAKAEREARLDREFLEKANSLPFVPGEEKAKANLLKSASSSMDPEVYAELEKTLSSMNEMVSKSQVFKSHGTSLVDEDTPEGRLEKLAKARSESDEISYERAVEKVLEENPDLYDESLSEEGS